MPEIPEEKTTLAEKPEPLAKPHSRFMSDFATLEKGINSFLELSPEKAKNAVLENQDRLEETRNALAELRNEIRGLLDLLKAYNLSPTKPKLTKPSLAPNPNGTEILNEVCGALTACRDSFRQAITEGNLAESTYKACKPPLLAHRLEQSGLMINDLIFFFERIAELEPLKDLPFKIQPAEHPEPPSEEEICESETEEESDSDRIEIAEQTKTLAEELAEQFLLVVRRFGLPKTLKIAKGYGQYYPGLVGDNLHVLDRGNLDDEMTKSCERLFGTTPNDELIMVRRGNRFRLAIVNKTALVDPTLIPKKRQSVTWD
jgi:hypothetical protein